jgi:hypothetical protein
MFGAHETQIHLAQWWRTLPLEVAAPSREGVITRAEFIHVIREELLPFVTYGRDYERPVADNLGTALRMFRDDRGDAFDYWLAATLAAAVAARRPGLWAADVVTVAATKWGVSYVTGSNIAGARLNVSLIDESLPNPLGGTGLVVRHPMYDGLEFASREDAQLMAWHAGLTQRYVSRLAVVQP